MHYRYYLVHKQLEQLVTIFQGIESRRGKPSAALQHYIHYTAVRMLKDVEEYSFRQSKKLQKASYLVDKLQSYLNTVK